LTSDVGLWRAKYDEAAGERDSAARERDAVARERAAVKLLVVSRIQMSERLLHRAVTDAESLMARPLDELRETAIRLQRDLMSNLETT
jgi:hypothetical protein